MRTLTGSRWMSNNYITRCDRRLELVGIRGRQTVSSGQFELEFQSQLEIECPRSENQPQTEGLGPQEPGWAASRMRKCFYCQRNLGSICVSLSPSPTHLSRITNINPFATLSRIKCERYIFIKKRVRCSLKFVILFRLCLYMYTYSCMWIYNKCNRRDVRCCYSPLQLTCDSLYLVTWYQQKRTILDLIWPSELCCHADTLVGCLNSVFFLLDWFIYLEGQKTQFALLFIGQGRRDEFPRALAWKET